MKHTAIVKTLLTGCAVLLISATAAMAQQGGSKQRPSALGSMGSSKEPIKIDSDRLDVFDKESKAIFSGNVIAVQGESTMKCSNLVVFYDQDKSKGADGQQKAAAIPGGNQDEIRKIECEGPVTIVNKTQVATGNHATFDRAANKVFLTGNATLSDGPNITRGERVVYNLNTQTANIENGGRGGRVRALFVPGSQEDGKKN